MSTAAASAVAAAAAAAATGTATEAAAAARPPPPTALNSTSETRHERLCRRSLLFPALCSENEPTMVPLLPPPPPLSLPRSAAEAHAFSSASDFEAEALSPLPQG